MTPQNWCCCRMSKKYLHSSTPSSARSVQCTALRTLSWPNFALIRISVKIDLPDGVWSQVLRDLWVMGSTEFSESVDNVFLSDL